MDSTADSFLQALVAEIEQNQTKLDECQTHSKQYCTSVKVGHSFCSTITIQIFPSGFLWLLSQFKTHCLCCCPLPSVGLRTAADDLPSLRRIDTEVTRQEEEDALFLGRHHSGGKVFIIQLAVTVNRINIIITVCGFLPPQFMDLRTRYTALVTLTTQHVKYISDALRRLEEEEVGLLLLP